MNRIEHYTTYLKGGAGTAARRIFDGISSVLDSKSDPESSQASEFELVLRCRDDQPLQGSDTEHFVPSNTFLNQTFTRKWNKKSFKQASQHYYRHLENRPVEFEVVSPARLYDPTPRTRRPPVDLIHLHWVAYLLDYETFFRSIPKSIPVVWTLHDMNAFTGGCHYSAGCDRYLTGCGNCFQLDNPGDSDLSSIALEQKKRAYGDREITVVTPSHWLTTLAYESQMFSPNTRFETIHYGLDAEAYRPVEKAEAKDRLGVDPKKTTMLFGAADVTVKRKGFEELFAALALLPDPQNYECVIFGDGEFSESRLQQIAQSMQVRQIGFLSSDEEKRNAYSAADLFLLPSLEDNLPQMGLESLACGTPVVAFDVGGIAEFVQHGETGFLANVNDSANLAEQIRRLAESRDSQKNFGEKGRKLVLDQFEIQQQTLKYLAIYRKLLAGTELDCIRAG